VRLVAYFTVGLKWLSYCVIAMVIAMLALLGAISMLKAF
jgi:hypothetical protein